MAGSPARDALNLTILGEAPILVEPAVFEAGDVEGVPPARDGVRGAAKIVVEATAESCRDKPTKRAPVSVTSVGRRAERGTSKRSSPSP